MNGVESRRPYGRTPAYRSSILVTVYEIRTEITFIVLCPLRATSLAGWPAGRVLSARGKLSFREERTLRPSSSAAGQSAFADVLSARIKGEEVAAPTGVTHLLRSEWRTLLSHAFPLRVSM